MKLRHPLLRLPLLAGLMASLLLPACRSLRNRQASAYEQRGVASWIADFYHGRTTAYGTVYDRNAFTAASPTLPYGTPVRVTHLRNGRSVDVVITDRFNYPGRIIDLSPVAAAQIGLLQERLSEVSVVPLQVPANAAPPGQGFATDPGAGYGAPPPGYGSPAPMSGNRRPAFIQPYNQSNPSTSPLFQRNGYTSAANEVTEPKAQPSPVLADAEPLDLVEYDGLDFDFDEQIRALLRDPPGGSVMIPDEPDFSRPNYQVQGTYPLPEPAETVVSR